MFCLISSLTKAAQSYAQHEKEALALVFALKKFKSYLWGQRFSLITDHKTLLDLFSSSGGISPMASGRIHR